MFDFDDNRKTPSAGVPSKTATAFVVSSPRSRRLRSV